jgi:hypothetical protein
MVLEKIMSQQTDLKLLERKLYTRYFDDGILDMLLGYYLLWGGLFRLFAEGLASDAARIIIMLLGFGLVYPLFLVAKRRITIARLGRVEFGPARRRQRLRLVIYSTIMVLATAGLVVLTASRGSTPDPELLIPRGSPIGPVLVGGFVALVIGGMALFVGFDRMLLWAGLFGVSIMLGMQFDNPLPQIAGGGLIIIVGAVYLVRFLKRYPRIESEELDAS